MYVIGLTGMIASGKSTVSEFLRQRGIVILDADKISHQVILKGQPAFEEIILYFGADCLGADGQIDRRKLGRIVFSETEKLEVLNRIVHPRVTEEILRQLQQQKGVVVIDAPLLIQAGLDRLCDEIWNVYAEQTLRIARIMARDHLEEEQALARVYSQQVHMPEDKPVYRIENSGSYETLIEQVKTQLTRIGKYEET
jgi:dephospho-CoA kinase